MSLTGLFPIDKWNFKSHSILNDLPAEEYEELSRHMTEQEYHKGETLFREGAVPQGIFFVRQGKVKKFKTGRDGKEQIIYVANSGEMIGYHAILAGERYPDTASTLEKSLIAFIPKEDFISVLEKSTVLPRRLLKTLSHEFSVLANSISIIATRPVKERLAIALIVLREKFKAEAKPGEEIVVDISRHDLANMAGTGNENVVRILKEFKLSGILETKGRKIFIHDVKKLVEQSGCGL